MKSKLLFHDPWSFPYTHSWEVQVPWCFQLFNFTFKTRKFVAICLIVFLTMDRYVCRAMGTVKKNWSTRGRLALMCQRNCNIGITKFRGSRKLYAVLMDVSQSCPGYEQILVPIRPRYLRKKGDGETLKKGDGATRKNIGVKIIFGITSTVSILYCFVVIRMKSCRNCVNKKL